MSLALFFALYCLEAGIFFIIVPWTRVWSVNPILQHSVAIAALVNNPFFRGFVSGFGLIHLIIGVNDIVRIAQERRESQ